MSETKFYPYETVDYVYTINRALQRVFDARAQVSDSLTYEQYLRTVEALVTILVPRLRPRNVGQLLEKARERDQLYGYYTRDSLAALDKLVEEIVEVLDKNRLLIRGESYEEERL